MANTLEKLLGSVDAQIDFIQEADDLREVNDLLTRVMAQQKVQALIKEENLSLICDSIVDLALMGDGDESENNLIAAAMLGRLSAVARNKDDEVFCRLPELFEAQPSSIEKLADGDERYYAAISFSKLSAPWLAGYCATEAAITENAEKARRVLFETALREAGSLSAFWQLSTSSFEFLSAIPSNDTRFKRVRRITSAASEIVRGWEGEVGADAGLALSDWYYALVRSNKKDAEEAVLVDILDDALSMILRIVELRFSNALMAQTYVMLDKARTSYGRDLWPNATRISKNLPKVRTVLKETALVLARQNRTDKAVMDVLLTAYSSRAQVVPAISSHFAEAQELEPDVRAWWEQAGQLKESLRSTQHKMGNSEDQQIGSLLINVEESKSVMEKLERAVVPFLEISDPPLSESVRRAVARYGEIALAARQLAQMRKLKHMELTGALVEYNPLQHEMLGGHQLGVRTVKVERDGIQKDFGGKIKILVKPRVTPAD